MMMNGYAFFFKIIFALLSVLFFTLFTATTFSYGFSVMSATIGIVTGIIFSLIIFSSDLFLRRVTLKQMNVATMGLFFGYLLGQAMTLILSSLIDLASLAIWPETVSLIKVGIFLFSVYFGMTYTAKASDEVFASIPFVKFKPSSQKKKDYILDYTVLCDTRIIDLAATGLLDNHLIIPRFILKEICEKSESSQDTSNSKARRAMEVVKKLEELPELHIRTVETDFPEIKDTSAKLIRLARLRDAYLMTAEASQIEQSSTDGIRIINMHSLAKALKPLTQAGEYISIKVQRYGKEARQGVGYLDDGTMVVINGGAEYIGEMIKAQVLSVKHTSSGRMIFCNAIEDEEEYSQAELATPVKRDIAAKNYFAL
jgi:uncharacterized protein YacL